MITETWYEILVYGLTLTGGPKASGLMIADLRGPMEVFEFEHSSFESFVL